MSNTINFPDNIEEIMNAPVDVVTGPRKAKMKAEIKMSLPSAVANMAKTRIKRIADAKRVHKKEHTLFKRELKVTLRSLKLNWKVTAKSKKDTARAQKKAEKEEAKEQRKLDLLAKKVQKDDKKSKRKTKAPKATKSKLTNEEKLANKAKRSWNTEVCRRKKWEREYQAKFNISPPLIDTIEEEFVEDAFVC